MHLNTKRVELSRVEEKTMKLGMDVLVEENFRRFWGMRVGAIVNASSVDSHFRHWVDILLETPQLSLCALFAPEHGLGGAAAYMVPVEDTQSAQLPIYSLYGDNVASLKPKPESLEGLDVLLFDIQDIGSRYYTYIYTMALAMQAAGEAGVKFCVVDRPNPLGGLAVQGNLVQPGFNSFVGMYPLPNRHGMTAGELALLFNHAFGIGCQLEVVACEGWGRGQRWRETGLAFIPPSPNMPNPETALVYPGMCLCEGTNLSEGRGTALPFLQWGAPWVDGKRLAGELNAQKLPGVVFRPIHFSPGFDKHAGRVCEGIFIHVTDEEVFLPWETGVACFWTAQKCFPEHFAFRTEPYEFVEDILAFDLLAGSARLREGMQTARRLEDLLHKTPEEQKEWEDFMSLRQRYLLYTEKN
ncbi:MAG: DUF1343 domain-containing protein [Proteobacteria bacterium]|nr:DUF1343 domain-containing protein [Cystobacterineae bacterium]MCL2259316.1 DUF1343 domain-containing protein [Cystobacterineae bacterium]MCL2314265.1 DUF1343 domain-containing protein [Pseudomonadota bacterium]